MTLSAWRWKLVAAILPVDTFSSFDTIGRSHSSVWFAYAHASFTHFLLLSQWQLSDINRGLVLSWLGCRFLLHRCYLSHPSYLIYVVHTTPALADNTVFSATAIMDPVNETKDASLLLPSIQYLATSRLRHGCRLACQECGRNWFCKVYHTELQLNGYYLKISVV